MVGDAISTPFKIPAYMKQTLHVNKVLLGQKKFVQPQLGSVSEKYPKDERLFLLQLHRSIVEKAAGANEKSYIIKGCEVIFLAFINLYLFFLGVCRREILFLSRHHAVPGPNIH